MRPISTDVTRSVVCLVGYTDVRAKIAEPIEMELTPIGPRNHVLDGSLDSQGEEAIFESCPVHRKAL